MPPFVENSWHGVRPEWIGFDTQPIEGFSYIVQHGGEEFSRMKEFV